MVINSSKFNNIYAFYYENYEIGCVFYFDTQREIEINNSSFLVFFLILLNYLFRIIH